METLTLNASTRTVIGKQVKQLRKQGLLPAVVYGSDRKSESISIDAAEFLRVFKHAGTSSLVNLKIDEAKSVKVLLHEPQLHPVKTAFVHADLYVVKMTEKLQTEIPFEFVGDAEAVSVLEGSLNVILDAVTVECFPDKLVPSIEIDITSLKTFDDVIRVEDLKLPEGIEVMAEADEVILTITAPRSEEEMAELEEAPVGEDADKAAMEALEVTGEKKAEETEE